jgi:hypothetical protein
MGKVYDFIVLIALLSLGTMPKYNICGLVHKLRDRNLISHFRNFWLTDRLILFPIGIVFRKYFSEIPTKSEFRRNSDRKVQLRKLGMELVIKFFESHKSTQIVPQKFFFEKWNAFTFGQYS